MRVSPWSSPPPRWLRSRLRRLLHSRSGLRPINPADDVLLVQPVIFERRSEPRNNSDGARIDFQWADQQARKPHVLEGEAYPKSRDLGRIALSPVGHCDRDRAILG